MLFLSVVAISRGLSLSTESDQKAASLLIDTSPDDSEVGGFVLGTKSENKWRLERKTNRAVVWGAICCIKWGSTQFYRNNSSEKYDWVFTPSSVRQRRKGRLSWFHLISRNCMDIYTGILKGSGR